jgi:phosphinothricin acetyltransferase
MAELSIRAAATQDLRRLTEIYNHYVAHTAVTFDIEPYTAERRGVWFEQFAETGRYRLLVAEERGELIGYAGTTRFRTKAAYETTVETTIYCAPAFTGKAIGNCCTQRCSRRSPVKISIASLRVSRCRMQRL